MEASRIARDYKENDSESYVVSSSFSDFEESDRVAPSLIASAVKKPVVIATLITIPSAAGPPVISATTTGGVLCLPPGYVVC